MGKYTILGVACSCILLVVQFVVGIVYLVEAKNYINGPDNLWIWVLIYVSVCFLSLIVLGFNVYKQINTRAPRAPVSSETSSPVVINDVDNPTVISDVESTNDAAVKIDIDKKLSVSTILSSINTLVLLGLLIWGCVIYNNLHAISSYPEHLWIYFMVIFWFSIACCSCVACLICCACCIQIITGTKMISVNGT
jgi:hypothetical protein